MAKTSIAWSEMVWNPVTGCTQVSPGCDNCYAKTIAESPRFAKAFPNKFNVTLHPERLDQPRRWRKPRMIFVNSMSDVFHKDIPPSFLLRIWDTMVAKPRHVFQILTKRPHRAAYVIDSLKLELPPHIWLGTSVENQTFADNRIPALLGIPAAVRWLSCEPLLGPLDLRSYLPELQWVVDGGESGKGRRAADYDWFRSIRDDCQASDTPYFHKQGNHYSPGRDRAKLDGRTWERYQPTRVYASMNWREISSRRKGQAPMNQPKAKRCPMCNQPLVVRVNGKTKDEFLGCERWPECKHTEELPMSIRMRRMGVREMF